MNKLNVAIITGGDTRESQSSIRSAGNVYTLLDRGKFNCYVISVSHWQWRLLEGDGLDEQDVLAARIDLEKFSLFTDSGDIHFDVAFIALHGAPGESGHLQGYLEMVKIPYTGSGILASSLAMDKQACKTFLASLDDICTPAHSILSQPGESEFLELEQQLGYPCIIKPNSYGSGLGVTLVGNRSALAEALTRISDLDQTVLAEQFISGREFTVGAIICDGDITVLPVAEVFRPDYRPVLKASGFSEFTDRQSAEIRFNPDIDSALDRRLGALTKLIGSTLHCRSFFRVDYILSENGDIYFLELNTIPGMTPSSVFTEQIQRQGINQADLYGKLICEALDRR